MSFDYMLFFHPMVDKHFILAPDKQGALKSGIFHGSALLLSGILSWSYYAHHQTNTLWFYLWFAAFWFVFFSAVTSIGNHCLLLLPHSLKSLRIRGNTLLLEWKNGDVDELVRKINVHGSRTILGIWGQTLDKRRVQATIRRRSLSREEVQELLNSLTALASADKKTS